MCSGLELGPGLVGRNPIPRGFRAATPKAKVARAAWEAERRQAARGGVAGRLRCPERGTNGSVLGQPIYAYIIYVFGNPHTSSPSQRFKCGSGLGVRGQL